jgi:outer membrane murein-binding lipoprotein Lpp
LDFRFFLIEVYKPSCTLRVKLKEFEMKHRKLPSIASLLLVLLAAGCNNQQEMQSLRQENQALTQRVAELQEQLRQADAPPAASQQTTQPAATEYIVREGDNLWSIARNELGSGTRYREILARNPQINRNEPLPIGTVLELPPR